MPAFICTACGMQYAPTDSAPAQCIVCEEERQYVPPGGQTWTTLPALAARAFNSYREHEPGLIGIGTQPQFAIGQRALLVCTPNGNVLWDCISLLDSATMGEWSRAFGGVPIHLHAADRQWIMRPDPAIELWDGETLELLPDLTLIRGGGHFTGGTMLHWAKGSDGRGALLSSGIAAALAPFRFDRIYGHYFDRVIPTGGEQVLKTSVDRYIKAIGAT